MLPMEGEAETKNEQPQIEEPKEKSDLDAAAKRRDERMRKVNAEMREMKEKARIARSQASGYKKPIADLELELDRLINTDSLGFLEIEEEERKKNALPLIDAAEEAERRRNKWREQPVESFDLPEKDIEKLLKANFRKCGEVADWLSKDYPEKKPGLGRESIRERIRAAIAKIDGSEALIQSELVKQTAESSQQAAEERIREQVAEGSQQTAEEEEEE